MELRCPLVTPHTAQIDQVAVNVDHTRVLLATANNVLYVYFMNFLRSHHIMARASVVALPDPRKLDDALRDATAAVPKLDCTCVPCRGFYAKTINSFTQG